MGPDALAKDVSLSGADFFSNTFNFADPLAFLIQLDGVIARRKEILAHVKNKCEQLKERCRRELCV
jgi:hypothetical protein